MTTILYSSSRPKTEDRLFVSKAVESTIAEFCPKLADEELAWMFENCYPNTLDTTVKFSNEDGKPDSFIITGDIDAMWLRDSAAQILPYLRLANQDEALQQMFIGAINRHAKCILLDPYANAFYREPVLGEWQKDMTEMRPGVHERKWELDSLCYFLRLSTHFWKQCGAASCFDANWLKALKLILKTLRDQQIGQGYTFAREAITSTETLALKGLGSPTRFCGLVRSAFRPSDDASTLSFLVPSNAFAVVELRNAAELCEAIFPDESETAKACKALATEIETALNREAQINLKNGETVFAYEVDGFGSCVLMDDANIPSLISLPYLGYCDASDAVYQSTRKLLLSDRNPYYFKGAAGEGIGGPHIGLDYIWPMGIIMRALTSTCDEEIRHCLKMLKSTHADTGFMHESFHKDNATDYTRSWFGWVNSLFGELLLTIMEERPHILTTPLN